MEEKGGIDGIPPTDYITQFDITQDQLSKIKDKYKRDKDF